MKFNLNEDGSKYLRVISWAQIWGQYNSDRPLDGNGNEQADLDFSVRRARVLLYAQINKDFLILTHIGLNSLNSNTMSPTGTGEGSQVFFMMFGLNTVVKTTPSRRIALLERDFSFEQSTLNLMTLDPRQAWATLGLSDQLQTSSVLRKGSFRKCNIAFL
jgi:hypothetical protein